MIRDALLFIAQFFIVEPFQVTMEEKLALANAPSAVIEQVQTCVKTGPDAIANQIASDWVAGAQTLVFVAVGITPAEAALSAAAPACATALAAAKPFLESDEA